MTVCRVQIVIPADSANDKDACVNTWGVDLDTVSAGGVAAFLGALVTFYNSWSAYRAQNMTWNQLTYKAYDLSDPEPRVPFSEGNLGTSTTAGTNSCPPELAVCLSFQGERVSGVSQARRRGRVYLGPLSPNVMGSDGRVTSAAVTAISNAGGVMKTASGMSDWRWGVISTATGGIGFTEVDNGWVDDDFDIQRRRGLDYITRDTF